MPLALVRRPSAPSIPTRAVPRARGRAAAPAVRRRRRSTTSKLLRAPRARRPDRGAPTTRRSRAGSPSARTSCCSTAAGTEHSSEAFARWLEERRQAGRDVCFVIGGAFGTDARAPRPHALVRPDDAPHQLARVVLLEQLYRAHKILAGEPTTTDVPPSRPAATSCGPPSRRGRGRPAQRQARRRRARRRSSARRRPASATTRRTPRCCSRPRWARRRGRSPSGSAATLSERLGERRRPRRGRRARASSTSSWPTPGTSRALRGAARRRRRRSARGTPEQPEKVNVEFVSANPTGPLTAASGRHAAYGDALARMLELAGHEVSREYYFNDAGSQVDRLGESVRARARDEPVPEDGYQGDYVAELAAQHPGRRRARRRRARARRRRAIMEPASARRSHALPRRVRLLVPRGHAARRRADRRRARDRAAATSSGHVVPRPRARCGCARPTFGDDKDRVLERSSGEPTYFAADVAYHEDKLQRGYRPHDLRRSAPTTTATSRG